MIRSASNTARSRQWRASATALDLLERAYALLRSAPPMALAINFLGTVPFAAALLYFWADMSRSSFAAADAGLAALALALAYGWMKCLQALFCHRLWALLDHERVLPARSAGAIVQTATAQLLIHSLALPLLLLSLVFLVPWAWSYAFFHNASVLALVDDARGGDEDSGRRRSLRALIGESLALAHWRWASNHVVIGILALLALLVWANLVLAAVVLPQLIKWLFGQDSVFTLFPLASLVNTTFILASLLVTYLIVGPIAQAVYVVRCYQGRSRHSGADLLGRLTRIRRSLAMSEAGRLRRPGNSRATAAVVTAFATVGLGLVGAPGAHAEVDAATPSAQLRRTEAEALDAAIDATLRGKAFQWRLARDPGGAGIEGSDAEQGFGAAMRGSFQRLGDGLKALINRLLGEGRSGMSEAGMGGAAAMGPLAGVVSGLSLLLLAALAGWLLVQLRRRARRAGTSSSTEATANLDSSDVDLESDDLVASQLPEEEWLELAARQVAERRWRLALRALFLAAVAGLGRGKLIVVARHKANRDYRRELEIKARNLPELQRRFAAMVATFDRVWYGEHAFGEDEFVAAEESCRRLLEQIEPAGGAPTLATREAGRA